MTDFSIAGSSGTTGLSHWTSPTLAGKMVAVDPSDTTTNPHGSAGADKWLSVAQLGGVIAEVLYPSGDNTGVNDATAINAAVTALSGAAGLIRLAPTAPWYIECGQVVINQSGLYLDMTGCTVNAIGAGDMIDMHDTSTFGTRTVHGGGIIGFPKIDGTAVTGNSAAVHTGDIFQLRVDVQAWNFTAGTTSKGVWFDNRWWICEQVYGHVFTLNCTAGIVFDVNSGATATGAHVNATGSFERCNLDLYTDQVGPTFDGVVFQNGAFVQDGVVSIHGNFGTSGSPLTSAAVRLNGSTPSGITTSSVSNISNSVLNIGCECDPGAGADAPFTINFGGSNFILDCTGNIDFGAIPGVFQSSNNAGQFAGFAGVVDGDPNLPSVLPQGSTNAGDGAQTVSATSATAITSLSAGVAAGTGYDIIVYLPHTGAGTSGTFTFAFGGPSISTANTNLTVKVWTGTTLTAQTLGSTSATIDARAPSASVRLIEVTGTIVFSAGGTLTVTGAKTAGGSNVTVAAGASIKVQQIAAP